MEQYPNITPIQGHKLKQILQNENTVIVEFGTNWSGASHIVAPIINDLMNQYLNIRMFRINAEETPEIIREYGIFEYPTYLFFKKGEIQDHIIGSASRATLLEKIIQLNNNDIGE